MKRRFNLNAQGLLEDRDGNVIGRLTSLTFETKGGLLDFGVGGDIGGAKDPSLTTEQDNDDGGVGEGPPAAAEFVKAAGELLNVDLVWEHYVAAMKPRNKALDNEARKMIREALKVATVAECIRAIDGCAASDFHMGRNARGRKYNSLSQILKAKRAAGPRATGQTVRERIDFFIDIAEREGAGAAPSADPARVRSAKLEVLDAWLYAGDESVVRRGEEAALWLAEHGIQVLTDPSETNRQGEPKPRFEATT